jgi:putative DNA primase/helicase
MDAMNSSHSAQPADFKYTTFENSSALTKKEVTGSWADLVNLLKNPKKYPTKAACTWIKLATFGYTFRHSGCLRHDKNVLTVTGIEGDYDGEVVSIGDARDTLNMCGVRAVLYTSASHTPDKPRWRVLLPLSRPHCPSERQTFVARLNGLLDGVLATESFTLSQSYFFGHVEGTSYEAHETHGDCIDEIAMYDLGAVGPKSESPNEKFSSQITDGMILPPITDKDLTDLESAATYLASKGYGSNYTEWISIGQALKAESLHGRVLELQELWLTYSRQCGNYKVDSEVLEKWHQLEGTKSARGVIFLKAQSFGWINPAVGRSIGTAENRQDRTDMGNVAILADSTNGNLRFVPERKIWLWWDGQCWTPDTGGTRAQTAALKVSEHHFLKAVELRKQLDGLDDTERKRIEAAAKSVDAWAAQCRNKQRLDNMLTLAKCDARFALPIAMLDTSLDLLGVANGVVDLRTGQLRDASRDDYVTKRSPVKFNPERSAPRWRKFIVEITSDAEGVPRPLLGQYVQRLVGYCLTGLTSEHKMFIAVGKGANGKNVLLDMVQRLMGDYCETITPEALMAVRKDFDAERAMPGARKLAGARAAISSESKDGQRLDVAMVKRHTGGGHMTARGLHENAFTFVITHKLWLMTNHKPALDHMDEAMRGRLHMIPFDRCWNRPGHPERNPMLPDGDKSLPEKLTLESDGILTWMVEGAVMYLRDGLEPPKEVVHMTRAYFKDQDPFGIWFDTCEKCDPKQGVSASDLFTAFGDWCQGEGFSASETQTAFSTKLTSRGVESKKTNKGKMYALRAGGDLF